MKSTFAFTIFALLGIAADAYVPQTPPKSKHTTPKLDLKKAAMTTFTAFTLASNALTAPILPAEAFPAFESSSTVVSEKVVRQGLYSEYEVDIVQEVDDARSTFKEAKETKSKKGKYTAIIAILVMGSFVIPMAQYFWYVRDDNSSDKFFNNVPEPEPEPPKKKGWFN